jgi:hypothetical protein
MQVLEKLSKSNKVTLMWIHGHQEIPGNEEADRLAKEGAVEVPPDQFAAIPFTICKNLIKKHLEQRHQARWNACTEYQQSKVLMRYPLPSRANELLAMNKFRLRAAVGLLTGHTSLRAHLHKLGYTQGQKCRLRGYEKEDSVHIGCDCPVLACKRYRILGCMFLKPEYLENVRVSSLLSLVANTGLGLVSSPHKPARRHNGTAIIEVSLRSFKEPLAIIYNNNNNNNNYYYYYYLYHHHHY